MWPWWLGIPSTKARMMMHPVWANASEKERAQSWGSDVAGGERRAGMLGGPRWIGRLQCTNGCPGLQVPGISLETR